MSEELDDPREVPWHPRHQGKLVGHDQPWAELSAAFQSGKPHHAWLITGKAGIGKATLAYKFTTQLLSLGNPEQAPRWLASRSHPDFFVLERSFNDSKPRRLRQEIVVDDARRMSEFFSRTASGGGWRVALVDCADDLNTEAANALLKLIEEPPPKALIMLVSHQPGRLLRTLRSRCRRLALETLAEDMVLAVLRGLPLETVPAEEALLSAVRLSGGAPGRALALLNSGGARAFDAFLQQKNLAASSQLAIAGYFSQRQAALADYETFTHLLLDWLAREAVGTPRSQRAAGLALAHQKIAGDETVTLAYNLDRRAAVLKALATIDDALKAG